MNELDISASQFAWIVSCYLLAAGVASLVATLVMDRFDRKSVLLAMYAGFGLSTLGCGLAPSYEWLLVARTSAGVFGGLAAVAIMAVIGDLFAPEKRGRATGAITSAFAVASIVGLPVGLWLAQWYGRGAPFIALAGLSAIVWIVASLRLPPVRGHLEHARARPIEEFVAVLKEGNHQRAFAFSFFMVLGTFTVATFLAPYLMSTNGWTESDLAIIYLVSGICTLIGMSVVGRLADRVGRLMLFRVLGQCGARCGNRADKPPGNASVGGRDRAECLHGVRGRADGARSSDAAGDGRSTRSRGVHEPEHRRTAPGDRDRACHRRQPDRQD